MVQCVWNDSVLICKKRLEYTTVGVEAGSIKNSILCVEILADSFFELFVDVLCSADEPHWCHSEATLFHHIRRSLDKARVVSQTEVVICAEVEDFFSCYLNGSRLRTLYQAFLLVEACLTDLSESLAEMLFHFSVHIINIVFLKAILTNISK